jgi:hypothetical protein
MSNVIFLIGGPGSGKDLIIKEFNSKFVLKEYNLEQIKHISSLDEDCIISSNAYKLDDIISIQEQLSKEHSVFAIYVDVSDEISKERLSSRSLNENVRVERLLESKLNVSYFKEMFDNFHYFNNSFEKNSQNITEQLNSLVESFSDTLLSNKRKEGLQNAKKNRILYKKKIDSDTKAVQKFTPPQLDKQAKDFVDLKLHRKLTHDLKHVPEDLEYSNFKTDKEVKKQKKIPRTDLLTKVLPKKGIGPVYDTRETGDTALIQTYSGGRAFESYNNLDDFLDEAVDSPNAADTGLFGMTSSPNVNQSSDKPLFGYQVSSKKNKDRKKNFETDKEVQKESTIKKLKKILFKG